MNSRYASLSKFGGETDFFDFSRSTGPTRAVVPESYNTEDDEDDYTPVTTDRFREFEKFYMKNYVLISVVQFVIILVLLLKAINK